MRASDLVPQKSRMRTFQVRIQFRQPNGVVQQMDTTVQARTAEMARRMLRAQYNNPRVLVGNPREIKAR